MFERYLHHSTSRGRWGKGGHKIRAQEAGTGVTGDQGAEVRRGDKRQRDRRRRGDRGRRGQDMSPGRNVQEDVKSKVRTMSVF